MSTVNKITLTLTSKTTLKTAMQTRSALIASKLADTLSLAYYGLCEGDISSLEGNNAQVVNSLEAAYRKYIPAKFDKVANKWVFNKAKASKLRDELNLTLSISTFDDFLKAVNLVETTNNLIAEMNKEQETPEQLAKKADDKVTKYLEKTISDGMSIDHIISLLTSMKALKGVQATSKAEFEKRLAAKLAAESLAA